MGIGDERKCGFAAPALSQRRLPRKIHRLTTAATNMITRTTLLGGPAAATFGGRTFFAQDGILITPALELEAVDSNAQGVLDSTATFSKPMTIQFAPNAAFADLLTLYPFLAGEPGASLFGGVDTPLD